MALGLDISEIAVMAPVCRSNGFYPRMHTSTLEIAGRALAWIVAAQNRVKSPR